MRGSEPSSSGGPVAARAEEVLVGHDVPLPQRLPRGVDRGRADGDVEPCARDGDRVAAAALARAASTCCRVLESVAPREADRVAHAQHLARPEHAVARHEPELVGARARRRSRPSPRGRRASAERAGRRGRPSARAATSRRPRSSSRSARRAARRRPRPRRGISTAVNDAEKSSPSRANCPKSTKPAYRGAPNPRMPETLPRLSITAGRSARRVIALTAASRAGDCSATRTS